MEHFADDFLDCLENYSVGMRGSAHVWGMAVGEKELVLANAEKINFVRDNGRDKVLKKIEDIQEQNKKSVLDRHSELWARYFLKLTHTFLQIHTGQLKQLDNEDLKYLDELIAEKARVWHRITQISFVVTPFIGWIGWIVGHNKENDCEYGDFVLSWHYTRERNMLKKNFGKDFFPADIFRKML